MPQTLSIDDLEPGHPFWSLVHVKRLSVMNPMLKIPEYDRKGPFWAPKIHELVLATSPNFYNVSRAVAVAPTLIIE